jgi:hypothetical protein
MLAECECAEYMRRESEKKNQAQFVLGNECEQKLRNTHLILNVTLHHCCFTSVAKKKCFSLACLFFPNDPIECTRKPDKGKLQSLSRQLIEHPRMHSL